MTRILQIHARYREAGGEDVVADSEAELLTALGHEVTRLRLQNADSGARAAAQLAAYVGAPFPARPILRAAKLAESDIVHFHNTWFAVPPIVFRGLKRLGIRTVATIHNYRLMCANALLLRNGTPCELCVGSDPFPGFRFRCYHQSYLGSAAAVAGIQMHRWRGSWRRHIDQFIAPTDFVRERLVATGLPADRIAVHRNSVPDPGRRPRRPSESRRVVYVGRLSEEKGVARAVDAWEHMAPKDMELVIAGDGPQRAELIRKAGRSVRFLGQLTRSQVTELLLDSRALLVPSMWYETGGPLVVLEAFSAGVPVLGSGLGGLLETLAPLGAGWTVARPTINSWAAAIERLTDDSLIDRGGQIARRAFETRHSYPVAQQGLSEIYRLLR